MIVQRNKTRAVGILLLVFCLAGGLAMVLWALLHPTTSESQKTRQIEQAVATNIPPSLFPVTTNAHETASQFQGILLIVSNEVGKVYLASGDNLELIQISSTDVHTPVPALSPDGTQIAFRDLNGYLNVYDILIQETTIYPHVLMSGLRSIGWSPDGEQIAYSCPSMPSYLCVYTLKTEKVESFSHMSNEQTGSMGGYAFAGWSSDKEKIGLLYYSEPPAAIEGAQTYYSGMLKILNSRTQTVTDILAEGNLSGILHIQDAMLSPDGSTFLFSAKSGDYTAVYQVNVDGTGLSRITPETLPFNITHPIWRPDGKGFVAYAPGQESKSVNPVYLPTFFDLSGNIIGQITIDEGGQASSWVGN